jgi:hypothetical protein
VDCDGDSPAEPSDDAEKKIAWILGQPGLSTMPLSHAPEEGSGIAITRPKMGHQGSSDVVTRINWSN